MNQKSWTFPYHLVAKPYSPGGAACQRGINDMLIVDTEHVDSSVLEGSEEQEEKSDYALTQSLTS